MARPPRRATPDPVSTADNTLFNGVVFAEAAIGLFWGLVGYGVIFVRLYPSGGDWRTPARMALVIIGLLSMFAADVFFRVVADQADSLSNRLLRSPRGGYLLTLPSWLVALVALGLSLALMSGEKVPPKTNVHIETNTPAEPTAVPADR